jgi:hypothetical protein
MTLPETREAVRQYAQNEVAKMQGNKAAVGKVGKANKGNMSAFDFVKALSGE